MSSIKLNDFIKEIKYVNRNPKDHTILTYLDETSTNPSSILKKGSMLYRCRLVESDLDRINRECGYKGYDSEASFVPPVNKTKDLRANYRFIPYLYAASSEELSVIETRPKEVDLVSVADIMIDEDLIMFDLRNIKGKDDKKKNVKDNFLIDLAKLFGIPVKSTDDQIDYIPTQYIAEYIKNLNYDGIIYPSSLTRIPEDYCVVIFNYQKCKTVGSCLKVIPSL